MHEKQWAPEASDRILLRASVAVDILTEFAQRVILTASASGLLLQCFLLPLALSLDDDFHDGT